MMKTGNILRKKFIEQSYTQLRLSTETSVGKVQSVVLQTDELNAQEKPHANTIVEILKFLLRARNFLVSHLKTNQISKLFDSFLYEEMQPVALEKNRSDTRKHHTDTCFLAK